MVANPPRLVVLTPVTARVFEGKKFLAEYIVTGPCSAAEVEEIRIADYAPKEAA